MESDENNLFFHFTHTLNLILLIYFSPENEKVMKINKTYFFIFFIYIKLMNEIRNGYLFRFNIYFSKAHAKLRAILSDSWNLIKLIRRNLTF